MDQDALGGQAVKEVERFAREAEAGKLKDQYEVRTINGETYVNKTLTHLPKIDSAPGILKLSTLMALRDYIAADPDEKYVGDRVAFVLIQSPTHVSYGVGADGPYKQRGWVASAEATVPNISWGQQWPVEQFLIALRSLFVETNETKTVVDYFSRIDAGNSVTLSDDGMTQSIVVNRGARGKESVKVPNPIALQPYRTFAEVDQPISPFLLRLHGGDPALGKLPSISLSEADMGRWRLAAVSGIKEWLRGELPKETLILG